MQFIFEIIYIKNIYGIYAFNKHRQNSTKIRYWGPLV